MINHLWFLGVLSCCLLLLGCGPQDKASREEKKQMEEVMGQIEKLVAEAERNPSADFSRVRNVCTLCGAWKESSTTNILTSLMEGAQPGSPEEKQITEAKKSEAPFFVRNLEQCGMKGVIIKAVYPGNPQWSKLDQSKRED